jgi:hypothetical protein
MSRDLAVFQGQKPRTTVRYASAATLEGSAKLVTRFTSLFLSDYDAVRDRGTDFNAAMLAGEIRTNAQILQRFSLAAAEVVRQLGNQSGLPSSERLQRADLADFARLEASIRLSVTLRTPDGTVDLQLPVGPQ